MYCGDQSNFVASNIKNREFSNLIGVRKGLAQSREFQKPAFSHNRVPTRKRWFGVRVLFRELVQALPSEMTCIIEAQRYSKLFLIRSRMKRMKEELGIKNCGNAEFCKLSE
jgi:hypothetical protein